MIVILLHKTAALQDCVNIDLYITIYLYIITVSVYSGRE